MSGSKPSRVSAALACGAAVAALLTACSDAEPETTPTASSLPPVESSPTPTPTTPSEPEPPALPAEAKGRSDAAVEAFVDYWVETLNYAMTTGETDLLQQSSSGCDGCKDYVDLYREIYSSGGYLETAGWTPTFKQVDVTAGDATVLLEVRAAPVRYQLKQGADTKRSGSNVYQLRLETMRVASGWVVTSLANA